MWKQTLLLLKICNMYLCHEPKISPCQGPIGMMSMHTPVILTAGPGIALSSTDTHIPLNFHTSLLGR